MKQECSNTLKTNRVAVAPGFVGDSLPSMERKIPFISSLQTRHDRSVFIHIAGEES